MELNSTLPLKRTIVSGDRVEDMEAQQSGPSEPVDGLLGRLEVIEAQPLSHRAAGYEQLAEELLAELQRSDHEHAE